MNDRIKNAWRVAATSSTHPRATKLSVEDVEAIAREMEAGDSDEALRQRWSITLVKVAKIRAALGLPPFGRGVAAAMAARTPTWEQRAVARKASEEEHKELERRMREATERLIDAETVWRLRALRSDPSPLARAAEAALLRELGA